MTSRTTPVGILVLALTGLIAVGCNAPMNAVFQALLDPAGTVVSLPEVDTAMDSAAIGSEDETWWPHPDGYEMDLPAGWYGVAIERDQTDELVDSVALAMPGLASRMADVLDGTKVRVSAIATDLFAEGEVSPVLLVLAQPTEGKRWHVVKTRIREQISELPGLSGPSYPPHDVVLPSAKGVRFDYIIDDPDLGELWVTSYLFRYGETAYLVNLVASADAATESEAIFESIAASLRFGV